jgi:hypothetical protein
VRRDLHHTSNRLNDLQLQSPTSYLTDAPRVVGEKVCGRVTQRPVLPRRGRRGFSKLPNTTGAAAPHRGFLRVRRGPALVLRGRGPGLAREVKDARHQPGRALPPPSGGPVQVGATSRLAFRALIGTDSGLTIEAALLTDALDVELSSVLKA